MADAKTIAAETTMQKEIEKLEKYKRATEEKIRVSESKRNETVLEREFEVAHAKYKKDKTRADKVEDTYIGTNKYYTELKRQIEAKFEKAKREYESALETLKQQQNLTEMKFQREYNPLYDKAEESEKLMKAAEEKFQNAKNPTAEEMKLKAFLVSIEREIEKKQKDLNDYRTEIRNMEKKSKDKQNGSEGS